MYRRLLIPVVLPNEVEPLIRFGSMMLEADGEIRTLHIIPSRSLPEVTRLWRASVNVVVPAHETGAALDIRVDPEVRAGADVPSEIIDSAQTHNADAILMTLRGDKRSRNPFVGHIASSVLHHAPCDVLIVNRLALAGEAVPRILIPTFAPSPSAKALRLAEEVSLHHDGAPIVTIGLGPKLDEAISPSGHSPRGVSVVHRPGGAGRPVLGRRHHYSEMILRAASRERYGLLLVAEEAVHGEGPLLTRRFLEEVFRGAPCPVMALRS